MPNKKIIAVLLVSLFFLGILAVALTFAQDEAPGLPPGLAQDPNELINQAKNKTETSWDYLSKEWKTMLLKNAFVSKADAFLTKFSFVFLVLFAMPYSLSITLLAIILLWIFFLIEFSKIISAYSAFSKSVAYIIAFAMTIIMAQMQILKKSAEFLGWLIFIKKGTIWNFVMILIIVLCFALLHYLSKLIVEATEKKKEAEEKTKDFAARQVIRATAEGLERGTKKSKIEIINKIFKGFLKNLWIILIFLIMMVVTSLIFTKFLK